MAKRLVLSGKCSQRAFACIVDEVAKENFLRGREMGLLTSERNTMVEARFQLYNERNDFDSYCCG